MTTLWYFPIEPLKARYTDQLCREWMPSALREASSPRLSFVNVLGREVDPDIKVGQVLDATGRGIFSLTQCVWFLEQIRAGHVKEDDIVFLQDFWTPGLEAIFYALDLHKLNIKFYSMLHAQSVDEFDFTYSMLPWIRWFELGVDQRMDGTFVASTIHRDQLRKAGWRSPIHVVSLPFGRDIVADQYPQLLRPHGREKLVAYCSRLDSEKNPRFMLNVAEQFLECNPDWRWEVTTSGNGFRSNDPGVVAAAEDLEFRQRRFVLRAGLTKEDYYRTLSNASVLFNSSWQDYVSWTLIEATMFGCDVCYPNFRSFSECVPADRLYSPNDVNDALRVLQLTQLLPHQHPSIARLADRGRRLEAAIVVGDRGPDPEANVWEAK